MDLSWRSQKAVARRRKVLAADRSYYNPFILEILRTVMLCIDINEIQASCDVSRSVRRKRYDARLGANNAKLQEIKMFESFVNARDRLL